MKIYTAALIFLGLFALGAGLGLLLAYPTMWAWNYLVSPHVTFELFGSGRLTFWQAFCLNFLCGTLLKSNSWGSKEK